MVRIYIFTIVIIAVLCMAIWKPTNAFFTDSVTSSGNVFAAASTFPSANPSDTPTPTPTGTPTPTVTTTPENIANHIVISEVQIAGTSATNDFVELYNPTFNIVTISGWKLRVKTSTGTESSLAIIPTATIAPHSFYLWANNENSFSTTVNADTSNGNNLAANNSIALLTSTDAIVDVLGWGNGSSQFIETTLFTANPTANQSLERKALSSSLASSMISGGSDEFKGNGFDANNNATDFILRTTSQPQNNSMSESP